MEGRDNGRKCVVMGKKERVNVSVCMGREGKRSKHRRRGRGRRRRMGRDEEATSDCPENTEGSKEKIEEDVDSK